MLPPAALRTPSRRGMESVDWRKSGSLAVSCPQWNPHWIRVAEEDEAMKIGPWVARKRKAFWAARFAVAVANCNASMIRRSQHIRLTD